jgi:hypothetical protein
MEIPNHRFNVSEIDNTSTTQTKGIQVSHIENEATMESKDTKTTVDSNGKAPAQPVGVKYDPDFTKNVIAATGPNATPRVRQVMSSLIRHLHDFAREVDLTVDEWMAGVELVSGPPKSSSSRL